jgi:hypothetical protein
LVEYLIPPKNTATTQGEIVSSLTLMSKGEKVYNTVVKLDVLMFFKWFPSMPKGEIVGMFLDRGRVCVFVCH